MITPVLIFQTYQLYRACGVVKQQDNTLSMAFEHNTVQLYFALN